MTELTTFNLLGETYCVLLVYSVTTKTCRGKLNVIYIDLLFQWVMFYYTFHFMAECVCQIISLKSNAAVHFIL